MKKLITTTFLLQLLCSSLFSQIATISVNSSQTYQTIEGIGGGIVYYQNWFTAHKNKQAIYDTIFTGLGLSGLRVGNWAQETTANLSNDVEIIKECKKQLGSGCFVEMSSWSAPASLKANGSLTGTKGGTVKASLKKENGAFVYDKFGAWWKQSLLQYQALGVYPDYISIQNEPDMDADYEATLFKPSETTDIASYGKALTAVASAINTMSVKPKIIGPEPLGIGWNTTQNYVNALDKTLLYGYCFHYYHSGVQTHTDAERYSYPDDYKTAMTGLASALSDKPMFMTENCSMRDRQANDAVYIAWIIANSFNINRVSSYLHWNLLWGSTGGGCINVENPWVESGWTTKQGFIVNCEYHGLRHFTKFIKKGWICIGASSSSSDVVTVAFKSPAGDAFSIVMVNKGSSSITASMSLPSGAPTANSSIIQTVPATSTWSKVLGKYSAGSTITLPANSVTTLSLQPANASPVVAITAPTTGSSSIFPKPITLTAMATDTDGTISKVEFYDGTTLIGTGTASGSTYTLTWSNAAAGAHTVTAIATDNSGNKTTSSAITISIVKPLTYVFNNATTDLWTNTANWTPAALPTAIDTAIIRTGEAKIAQDFAGTIKVEPNGILRALAFTNLSSLELLGGAIKVNTSNQTYGMKANIVVKEASSVISGSNIVTLFTLDGTIAGSANLTKKDLGIVKIKATAADFKGMWIVDQDTLTIASATGLGQCGAIVNTAVLDIDIAASTNALTLNKGGKLNLDANLTVQAAVFDTINLAAGTYTAANYPAFISGNGSLIVAKSLLTSVTSNNSITLSAGVGSIFSWNNGSTEVATTAIFTPTASGAYTLKASTAAGCSITSAPVSVQAITLEKGWNLISINLIPDTTIVDVCRDARPCVSTIFAGLDVREIKDMNSFWRKGQADVFNSLKTIVPGEGYLVNMNAAGKLMITGMPVQTRFIASLQSANWNLIGCPFQSATPFSQDFNTTNCSIIKDFNGFWIPNGTTNSIQNLESGKGYFLKK